MLAAPLTQPDPSMTADVSPLLTLYYAPEACSLAPHIVLRELGLPHALSRVDNRAKRSDRGEDFLAINPKGYVAALKLADGRVLTEGPAILLYLADLKPEAGLAPPAGSWARHRLHEWLAFISAEIHGGFGPLFNTDLEASARAWWQARLEKRLDYTAAALDADDWLLDAGYSVADAYLYTVLRWAPRFGIALGRWPALHAYMARINQRPHTLAALQSEA